MIDISQGPFYDFCKGHLEHQNGISMEPLSPWLSGWS